MGTAYTPGLKVSPFTAIRKVRRLPRKGEVLVQVGDRVRPDTVVARALLPGNMSIVKVAGLLGVETFSSVTGNMGIREPSIPLNVDAYVEGVVVEVMPEDGCVVEAQGAFVQGIFGVGGERQGIVQMAADSPETTLTAERVLPEHAGRILVGGALVTGDALRKASELGVAAVVAGGIVDTDVEAYVGHSIGVAITGQEDVTTTLVITEGFGQITMAQRTFDLLCQHNGRVASVNGATQIRAGVIRPEVIIPLETPKPVAQASADGSDESHALDLGTPIRIIREPYFGQLANVTALPPELTPIPSGARVRVLEAELRDGRRVVVPRANVEIIEG